ncbi:MAG: sarcosine oxidase subunit gamma [Acidobacteriota bacterium]|nr:sarcosine oxidase subunit gamma [Acidobacteriota bacterium]
MSDPRQESPLAGFLSDTAAGDTGSPGVILTERPFLGYVNLRGDAGDARFPAAVEGVLGVSIPVASNTIAEGEDITVCWMGPDEWLVILPPGAQTQCVTDLSQALGQLHASAVDTTGGYTLVNVAGGRRRELLAKGCTLDLHPRSFSPGQCAQTNLGKAGVLLIPRGDASDAESFDVIVRRSFADYLGVWLEHSGREYGLRIIA